MYACSASAVAAALLHMRTPMRVGYVWGMTIYHP